MPRVSIIQIMFLNQHKLQANLADTLQLLYTNTRRFQVDLEYKKYYLKSYKLDHNLVDVLRPAHRWFWLILILFTLSIILLMTFFDLPVFIGGLFCKENQNQLIKSLQNRWAQISGWRSLNFSVNIPLFRSYGVKLKIIFIWNSWELAYKSYIQLNLILIIARLYSCLPTQSSCTQFIFILYLFNLLYISPLSFSFHLFLTIIVLDFATYILCFIIQYDKLYKASLSN